MAAALRDKLGEAERPRSGAPAAPDGADDRPVARPDAAPNRPPAPARSASQESVLARLRGRSLGSATRNTRADRA